MNDNEKRQLIDSIKLVLAEVAGKDLSDVDPRATFFEMGFDSLLLTQVATQIRNRFKVKITFRQLLGELSSIDGVAKYLKSMNEEVLPLQSTQESNQTVASRQVSTNNRAPHPAAGSVLERVINEQLKLMERQIELLKGKPGAALPETPEIPNDAHFIKSSSSPHGLKREGAGGEDTKRFGPFKAIEIGPQGGLTLKQERSLKTLTERYNRRTAGSKAYAQKHRSHFCDPRAAGNFRQLWKEMVYPIVCTRSKGGKIWDIDGNEYVDLTLGFGANYFGHSPDFLVEALEKQLGRGIEIGPQSPLAGEVAQMLCEITGMERATFCNTGSEAVMAAIRVTRTVTGREKIVYFTGDYHGIFDEVLGRAALVGGGHGALPIAPGIPALSQIIILEYGHPASLEIIRNRADEIAGIIVEPVQSRHPNLQPRDFLHALRQLATEKDIALIFDEVVTGFRTAPGGAQEFFGVRSDLATYGKVVAAGMPIGVLAGARRFMDALDGGSWSFGDASFPEVGVTFFAGTFVRHPLAMAATHATLRYLKQAGPGLQKQTNEKTAWFVNRLNNYFSSVNIPLRLQTFSSFFFCDFHPELKHAGLLFYHLRDRGVHIWEGRVGQICTAHTEAELDLVFEAFKSSVEELQAGELFPASASTVATRPPAPGDLLPPKALLLTEAQREIWISCQMGDDANCAYNESCSLYLEGAVNTEALQRALRQVLQRHDAFRARFNATGDFQTFETETPIEILQPDFSTIERKTLAEHVEEIIARDMATPFDLVHGPLVRIQLLRLDNERTQLLFTTHHIVCDGFSIGIVFGELAQLYSALANSQTANLPPAMPFAEFIRWSNAEARQAESRKAERYWIPKFENTEIPILDLPPDRPRPGVKSYHGSLAVHRCAPEFMTELKKTSAQLGNTLFTTLFTTFNAFLYRLSGQPDVIVGIPAAGQTMIESDDLVGHCLNLLPLRAHVTPSQSFAEFTGQVKNDVLDAYDHQYLTYGTVIQKLKLPRDASRLPLLSVMFNIDKQDKNQLAFSRLKASLSTNPKQFVNFDLFINLVQKENELDIECEFNTDLFDPATMQRWLGYFEAMATAVARNPRLAIQDIPLPTLAERSRLLVEWNQTARAYNQDTTIHALFEARAREHPDKIAVQSGSQSLSYGKLNAGAEHLAEQLYRMGAGLGHLVGVYLERSVDMVAGVMGVLKSGAAYVPMDPTFPSERLARMVENAKLSAIVTHSSLVSQLPANAAKIICVDSALASPAPASSRPPAKATDLAYVIFTSGSTGRPKGVQIQHRAVVNFLESMRHEPGICPDDVLLAVTTLSFDIAGLELFLPLTSGASLVIAPRETVADGRRLREELEKQNITIMQATPVTWTMLLEAGWKGRPELKILCGGEALSSDLAKQLISRCGSLWNMYGPTETTIWSTVCRINDVAGAIPIGRPVDNTQVYIVDERLQPVPVGIPGEMLIGGDGLAVGYLNQPELTNEKFIPNPFAPGSGSRLYRTGDLARYWADGTIECLGRNDQQVKLRGFRIELGEIESVLRTNAAVKDCVVILREDVPGNKQLAAYVSLRSRQTGQPGANGASFTAQLADELKALAQAILPAYMVPLAIVMLETLPRTPNGKLDRKALPAPANGPSANRKEFVGPRNAKEEALARIWMEVLGLDRVSVFDNFFELGGDSLLSFRVANRASLAGLSLTPRMFFQQNTIAGLAQIVSESGEKAPRATISRVSRTAHRAKLPAAMS